MLAAVITGCSESGEESGDQASSKETKEDNVSESKSFLEENKDKPGVSVTASGLQYKVLLEGTGKSPAATDTVTVHYEGTLTDGTKFDSSYDRGTPASFPLNRVIRGWTEGLQLMKEGGKYKFFIPSDLAYGPQGAGGVIGPNEDLIFTVELIRVN
ncbi:FKBP-type peptidyl-prolyl cis-trans isomerase [Emcibacter sp.]|uniref:FKBP-type peptidyl-prolyl cis-trans isomerase n=1 Tax=Emcibacter sp. TaxID=1979954 RepID=UPI003A93B0BE